MTKIELDQLTKKAKALGLLVGMRLLIDEFFSTSDQEDCDVKDVSVVKAHFSKWDVALRLQIRSIKENAGGSV